MENLEQTNRFDQIELPPGTEWDLSELYATGQVTLISVPEPRTFVGMVLGILFVISAKRRRVRSTNGSPVLSKLCIINGGRTDRAVTNMP